MPVAIRKRSWEEHVTHASGLQYSYDDLDLVCCHGVDGEGLWVGAGVSQQGRRTRCASMPEGCHQLPSEDSARTLEATPSVLEPEGLKLMVNNVKVSLDLQEESVHDPCELVDVDIPRTDCESRHLQTTEIGTSGERRCCSNDSLSIPNQISGATNEDTAGGQGDVGGERGRGHDICGDGNVFKSPHISREEEQCDSMPSNNGRPLSECAGEQPGQRPNRQETKASHTEGYSSSPPEISEATLSRSSAAELETQTDLPHAEEAEISTPVRADLSVALPVGEPAPLVATMETVDPSQTPVVGGGCDKVPESCSGDSTDKPHALNGPETLNENTGLNHQPEDVGGGEQDRGDCAGVLDQARGCEILLDQHNVEMTAMPPGEESAQAESSEEAGAAVRYGPITSSGIRFKGQCCSLAVEKLDTGYSEGKAIQADVSQRADGDLEKTASPSRPDQSSASAACCEARAVAQQLENVCLKLDTIPEVGHVEPDDTPARDPQKNSDFTPNPDVERSHVSDKHQATERPPCPSFSAADGRHGNEAAPGRSPGESPASEAADGQRERHAQGAVAPSMEEADEAARSHTKASGPGSEGANHPGDQKEDGVVKVRMRKVRQCGYSPHSDAFFFFFRMN